MADKGKEVISSGEQRVSSRRFRFVRSSRTSTKPSEPVLGSDDEYATDSEEYGDEEARGRDVREKEAEDVLVREVRDVRESSASVVMLKRGKAGRFVGSGEGGSSTVEEKKKKKKGKDIDWILKGPCPGGPKDPSVIPSFGGHVALALWHNPKARGVLTGYNRPKLDGLLKYPLPPAVRQLVHGSGLVHLGDCMYTSLDMNLLSAFIERWQPDTNTFHLPFGEMTILLHDVDRILRIPIEGNACCMVAEDSEDADDSEGGEEATDPVVHMAHLLGKTIDQLSMPSEAGGKIRLFKGGAVLIDGVKKVLTGTSRHEDDRAQAYLAMMLGMTLFVDKTGDRIRPQVFPLVSDLETVSGYAWGAGALAYLYRQLGMASRVETKGIAGCLTLLQAWIYEYFPRFRPGDRLVTTGSQPRAMCWARGVKYSADGSLLCHYRELLDDLTPQSIEWQPFDRIHPRSLFTGTIRYMDIVEPYQPDRCLRQFGYVQVIPHRMPNPQRVHRPKTGTHYTVEFPEYTDHAWRTWPDHRVVLSDRSRPCRDHVIDHDPKYHPWYSTVSHIRVIDPDRRGASATVDDDHVYREIGRALAQVVIPVYSLRSDLERGAYMRMNEETISILCSQLTATGMSGGESNHPRRRRVRHRVSEDDSEDEGA